MPLSLSRRRHLRVKAGLPTPLKMRLRNLRRNASGPDTAAARLRTQAIRSSNARTKSPRRRSPSTTTHTRTCSRKAFRLPDRRSRTSGPIHFPIGAASCRTRGRNRGTRRARGRAPACHLVARLAYWAGHARLRRVERRRPDARVRRGRCGGIRHAVRAPQGWRVPLPAAAKPATHYCRRAVPGRVDESRPRPRELRAHSKVHDLALSTRAQPDDRSLSRQRAFDARFRRRRGARGRGHRAARSAQHAAGIAGREPRARRAPARCRRRAPAGAARGVSAAAGGGDVARGDRRGDRRGRGDREEPPALRSLEAAQRARRSRRRSARGIAMSEMERDSRVDTAWKAASREEPPVALDDAIRAAARKAVDTQPRRARDKHWWYPYAAAATVAVIAVGLLQVTPPEQVTPTIVADADRTQKQDAPAAVVTPAPPPEASAPTMAAPATPPSSVGRPASVPIKKESRASEAPRGAAPAQNATQRELDATDKLAQPAKPTKRTERTEPAETAEKAAANKPAQLQASPPGAAAPRAEPFPAAAQSSAQSAPVERRDA